MESGHAQESSASSKGFLKDHQKSARASFMKSRPQWAQVYARFAAFLTGVLNERRRLFNAIDFFDLQSERAFRISQLGLRGIAQLVERRSPKP